ncbi:MAG TPA: YfiR family protein [Rickettsiales bacterium]|nr:YfiR family protein [Rickettsiales bacterium]
MALLIRQLWFFVLLLTAGFPAWVCADTELQLQEQEIKAGLLYNFLKYTQWPAAPRSMVICIYGQDPFEGYLQPIAGRSVNQAEIVLHKITVPQETEGCNLLFLNADEKTVWPQVQKTIAGKAVLTVSDYKGFAEEGGMIEFGRKNDHINVDLNMEALTAARLQVQDRLLKLVTVVHPVLGSGRP